MVELHVNVLMRDYRNLLSMIVLGSCQHCKMINDDIDSHYKFEMFEREVKILKDIFCN